ncbi:stage VI sporulation protein D [Shouchella patagoniensis]|uniref:stage VI sporulation protein D n=1 Tax=Shouchella patagoniensis TaxID=228576 RepID=UPI000995335D|nr:stage VI sporulation protein D [Shouchella patagoniensis]
MTQEQSSTLTFSIEDSVWLNKGQQIDEILGMSLTPEIYVNQDGEHVTIKGGLRFIGEYKVEHSEEVEQPERELNVEEESFTELSDFRQSGEVHVTNEGTGEIEHLFPIDITIPMARIQHVDDIYVEIASFDYDLPEKGCIQLTADVCISGMKSEEDSQKTIERDEYEQEDEQELVYEQEEEQVMETAFSFEAYKQDDSDASDVLEPVNRSSDSVEQDIVETYRSEPASEVELTEKDIVEIEAQTIHDEPDEEKKEEQSTFEAFSSIMQQNEDKESVERYEEELEEETLERYEEELEEETLERYEEELEEETLERHEEELEEETLERHEEVEAQVENKNETEKPIHKKARDENASYLTSMLRNEEEQFSKWRMCIIQEADTLESIAERYELSTSQLTRYNNLASDKVEEGQILYIPVSVN